MIIHGQIWPYMPIYSWIYDQIRSHIIIYGHVYPKFGGIWSYMIIYVHIWIIYEHIWIIYEHIWTYMTIYEHIPSNFDYYTNNCLGGSVIHFTPLGMTNSENVYSNYTHNIFSATDWSSFIEKSIKRYGKIFFNYFYLPE